MPNYYLFSPLLDEKGKQVVRTPKDGEYFLLEGEVTQQDLISSVTPKWEAEYPILTLKIIDSSAIEGMREVWKGWGKDWYENIEKEFPYLREPNQIQVALRDSLRSISDFIKEVGE